MIPDTLSAATGCTPAVADLWAPHLSDAMAEFDINTPARVAAFLAQTAHESQLFTRVSENLNYSAERLLAVFPKYFTPSSVWRYERKPPAIAALVYAGRMGNGEEASCDGWHFRGRGLIQLTGRDNYRECGAALDVDLVGNPDMLTEPDLAARSACWYWHAHGINALADAGRFDLITRKINGGTHGSAARTALWDRALEVLAP
jgi:putative chitinase